MMDAQFILEWLGGMLMVAGGGFILIGALGIARMPGLFTRLHPAGVSDAFGLPLLLLGVALHGHYGLVTLKLLLLAAFAMITSATACHALAKAALHQGGDPLAKKHSSAEDGHAG
jgi:multicomponent Na+:H+ antiporter subunit G